MRAGALAPEEAAQHPQRSVITRALGADWQIDIDVWTTPARSGDVILLCTDGLSGFVDEAAVAETLREHETLDAAVHALVDAANAAGGEDNITAVALRLEVDEGQGEPARLGDRQATSARPAADRGRRGAVEPEPAASRAGAARAGSAADAAAVALAVPPPCRPAEEEPSRASRSRRGPCRRRCRAAARRSSPCRRSSRASAAARPSAAAAGRAASACSLPSPR